MTTERTKTLTNGTKVIVTRGRGLNPNAPRLTHWTVRAEDGTWIADGATMREALSNANALVGAEVSVMVSGEIRDGKGHHPSATFLGGNHCRMADEIRRARA